MITIFAVINEHYLSSSENRAWKKIQACTGFEPMTFVIRVQRSTHWANKPIGSSSLSSRVYLVKKKPLGANIIPKEK